jgi:hypothetical protein
VNVAFSLNSKETGLLLKTLIVTEDLSVSRILTTSISNSMISQPFDPLNITGGSSAEWTGYQYPYSGAADTQAQWGQSGVSPPGESCQSQCVLLSWVGESDESGGGGNDCNPPPGPLCGIAQGGSWADVDCTFGCGPATYGLWFEFFPKALVPCNNIVAPNQIIKADISNTHSGSAYTYNIYVIDTTNDYGCSAQQQMTMGAANWNQFMAEEPAGATLPKFSDYTVYAAFINGVPISALGGWNSYYIPGYTSISPVGWYRNIGAFFTINYIGP